MVRRASMLVVALVVALAGCAASSSPAYDHPAAQAVQELLELRRDDVRDADAYAPYFLESDLATALAEGSDGPAGTPRVPAWDQPYVSEEVADTASVVVVWKDDADFPDWPAVNIFTLTLDDDRWVVTDAIAATSAPQPIGAR